MTVDETCTWFSQTGAHKIAAMRRSPLGFTIAAMLGGAYIGIALVLALTVSSGLPAGVRPLAAGSVFGLGLLLVSFAGAELFTGSVMYAAFGLARGTVRLPSVLVMLLWVWLGNLIGSMILAWVFATGGGGAVFAAPEPFLHDYVAHKVHVGAGALVARASLCNWLVCLAIWTPARIRSEAGKILALAWCLLAFVASGFEHSVANMTLFTLAGLSPDHPVDLAGAAHNLLWVTLGNVLGGSVLVASAYLGIARTETPAPLPR
ncbi:formate/nitrite transporter family protein [Sphingomonas morindae]|uniref:Formate/nitrite transporter family protein n=1 Tax=Sphingomonas morindae TaxID=1541170 RepID=A0ABY4X753_9SPHN|nr:formate/nitrite transporter family protein [Sphingomonas morindae]USI72753.1 formate/nitrite transporter family protein [Sphingomonas morindae]